MSTPNPSTPAPSTPARVDIDRDSVGRDLAALVLTVVELLRQLMERQAVRRIDAGGLTEDQIERIGTTLMLLDQRMSELCDQHGLTPEDLNLDLGPLGTLLPRD
ncbi:MULTISPECIES: gas vesicle protein K [unclassified Streptomyces]|uniref:gas vesicle protein K n=1 Tax=unclassified Streptomyces TaxID=2593676 RepID=UPI00168B40CF|nr:MULTISPECIES: gas vesicle protein K [unclassified Streptomyces]MBD3006693.1 gas vesicle protein K [Streptomyces sp. 5-10]